MIAGIRRLLPEPGVSPPAAPAAATGAAGDDGAQWHELATAVDELVEVVLVQQDLIENLLTRMSRLEGRAVAPKKARRGA